jgi:hypothetical protein
VEEQFAGGRGGVDRLLHKIKVDADAVQVLDALQEVDEGAPEAVEAPAHHHVELFPLCVPERGVQAGPLLAPLGRRLRSTLLAANGEGHAFTERRAA